MAVYLTGDTHGDFSRFAPDAFPCQDSMTKQDYVIICGDFGGVWNGSPEEQENLDHLDALPFTTLFVSGNHENFDLLASYPEEIWNGGQTRKIRPSVRLLTRGQVFDLNGKKFFTMGGASSRRVKILKPDDLLFKFKLRWNNILKRPYWIENFNWWPAELPNKLEYQTARENLDACDWNINYIITHCAPTSIQNLLDLREAHRQGSYLPNDFTDFLDEIANRARFQLWFMGHYHGDIALNNRFLILYNQIIKLNQD